MPEIKYEIYVNPREGLQHLSLPKEKRTLCKVNHIKFDYKGIYDPKDLFNSVCASCLASMEKPCSF